MDALQKEQERIYKRSQKSVVVDRTQDIIDALQSARDAIAKDASSAQLNLAKLQNPVKTSFESINSELKEVHGGHNKYAKALDKFFKDKQLSGDNLDALTHQSSLVNRAIYLHLLREGHFSVASTFHEEAISKGNVPATLLTSRQEFKPSASTTQPGALLHSFNMEQEFEAMYHILHELKQSQNLEPAISWARKHTENLEKRGSNLEFELCRLKFVHLFLGIGVEDEELKRSTGQERAFAYARQEFQPFRHRYMEEIQKLITAMVFSSNLEESPYHTIFASHTAWDEVADSFTREFCSMLELSADSPLYIAATAGAIALPTLMKLQTIMQQKKTEWTSVNELPVEILLPPSYQFHSIFVCPVSKEQTTDENPPMMMPCGHAIAQESLQRLSKGSRFKCPYCPGESHPREAKRLYL